MNFLASVSRRPWTWARVAALLLVLIYSLTVSYYWADAATATSYRILTVVVALATGALVLVLSFAMRDRMPPTRLQIVAATALVGFLGSWFFAFSLQHMNIRTTAIGGVRSYLVLGKARPGILDEGDGRPLNELSQQELDDLLAEYKDIRNPETYPPAGRIPLICTSTSLRRTWGLLLVANLATAFCFSVLVLSLTEAGSRVLQTRSRHFVSSQSTPVEGAAIEMDSPIEVRGPQYQQLVEALNDAFPSNQQLSMMLQFRLSRQLAEYAALPAAINQAAFELIQNSNAEGWTAQLIVAARESRPGNPKLLKLAQDFGLTAATAELERMVREDLAFLDVTQWRERLGEMETRVCRVETPYESGTGFLVGPDLVITNFHVMKTVIENPASAAQVIMRFDFKQITTGGVINKGTEARLDAGHWLVDSSPYSPCDLMADPASQTPALDQLDYALLRLDGELGDQPVAGETAEPGTPKRGWIQPLAVYPFSENTPIFILQHPLGQPLKLAMNTKAIIGQNANATRVRYTTNTEKGSSGSPVFNQNWELVALHQSGDRTIVPRFNQGIPMVAITRLLQQRGHALA